MGLSLAANETFLGALPQTNEIRILGVKLGRKVDSILRSVLER